MPEKIIVKPFDSIHYKREIDDPFLAVIPINQGYGIFFQTEIKKNKINQLQKGVLKYIYTLTYPVPLRNKLD